MLNEIGVEVDRANSEIKSIQFDVKKCSYSKEIDFNSKNQIKFADSFSEADKSAYSTERIRRELQREEKEV